MTPFDRAWLRARQALLRSYELFLYALLAALAVLAALPAAPGAAHGGDPPQCGKNQSSPLVITR